MSISPMSTTAVSNVDEIAARIERLPLSAWQVQARCIVGVATFFDAFDALAIAYVLPALIRPWSLTPGQIGLAISIGYVGQLIGALLSGWFAERYGRLHTTILTVFVYSLFSLLLATSWNLPALLTFRFLQGLGLGGEVPIAATYISEMTKAHKRGRFVLLYELIFPFGLIAAALAGFWIVPHWGWRWLFLIGGATAFLILYMRRQLPESPRWLASVGRVEEAEAAMSYIEERVRQSTGMELPAPQVVAGGKPVAKTNFRELFSTIYRRRTLVVWTIWFASCLSTYGLQTWLPSIYTSVYKLPLSQALGFSLTTISSGILGTLACALLIDRLGRKFWIALASLLCGIFLLALWVLGSPTAVQLLLLSALAYVFVASINLAVYLYTPELYPTRMRAFGTSAASAWLRLGSIIGPFIVGAILTQYALSWVFLVFGGVSLLGGIVTVFFAVETREQVLEKVSP